MVSSLDRRLVDIINSYTSGGSHSAQMAKNLLIEVKKFFEDEASGDGLDSVININECATRPEQSATYLISLCVLRSLPDVAVFLLDKGADPDLPRAWDYKTALHFTAEMGSLEFIEILSLYDADFNAKDYLGLTPLHSICKVFSVEDRHLEAAELLIRYGADINSIDQNNKSPLHSAVEYFQDDLIKLLLDNNADQNLIDNDGNTALQILENLEYEGREKTLQIFKDHAQEVLSKKILSETKANNERRNKVKAHMRNRPKIGGIKNA